MYTDKTLNCRDCGQAFIFTTGEQEFFASRGFTNEPSRCPECRAERKRSQSSAGGSYGGGYERRERANRSALYIERAALFPFARGGTGRARAGRQGQAASPRRL